MLPQCQCKAALALDPCYFRRALPFTASSMDSMEVCVDSSAMLSLACFYQSCAFIRHGSCAGCVMTPISALQPYSEYMLVQETGNGYSNNVHKAGLSVLRYCELVKLSL